MALPLNFMKKKIGSDLTFMESKIKKSIRQNKNDTKTTQNNWHDTCIKIWRGALSKIVSFVLHHPSKVFPSDASHASELNYPLK